MAKVARYVTASRLCRDNRGAAVPPSDRQRHRAVLKKRLHGNLGHCRWRLHTQRHQGHPQQDQGDRANGLAGPRLVGTQPPPPGNSLYENTLTKSSPADRPARAPAPAVAFTTTAAIRGAGTVHRRTRMQRPAPLPVTWAAPHRRTRLTTGNPPPALSVIYIRCFTNHRPALQRVADVAVPGGVFRLPPRASIPGRHGPRSTLYPAVATAGARLVAVGHHHNPAVLAAQTAHRRCKEILKELAVHSCRARYTAAARHASAGRPDRFSGAAVGVEFHASDLFDQHVEVRRLEANDTSGAHGVVVGSQAGSWSRSGTRRSRPSRHCS